jgi:hypothetical protein
MDLGADTAGPDEHAIDVVAAVKPLGNLLRIQNRSPRIQAM